LEQLRREEGTEGGREGGVGEERERGREGGRAGGNVRGREGKKVIVWKGECRRVGKRAGGREGGVRTGRRCRCSISSGGRTRREPPGDRQPPGRGGGREGGREEGGEGKRVTDGVEG
jgi:hypothetical protein